MDTFRLEVRRPKQGDWPDPVLVPVVNGRALFELLRPIEKAFGAGDIAGAYDGISTIEHPDVRSHLLSQAKPDYYHGKVAVLGCECGVTECWPLVVRIIVTDQHIVWTDFEQPHRSGREGGESWSYGDLSFRFGRREYEEVLTSVARQLADTPIRFEEHED